MMNFNENTMFFAVMHHSIFVSFAVVVGFAKQLCSHNLFWAFKMDIREIFVYLCRLRLWAS